MKKELSVGSIIESMTQSEKRYFKLNQQFSKKDKNYVKLFDLFDKIPNADNTLIKQKLKNVSSNISQEKVYLQWQLLHSLHGFHEQHSYNIKLNNVLCEIEVLYNKRLFDWCLKLIYQNKSIAREGEYMSQWLQLLEWEQRCSAFSADVNYFNGNYNKVYEEEQHVLAIANELMQIKKEKTYILSFLFPSGYLKDGDLGEFIKVLNRNLKKKHDKFLSIKAILQHLELLCLGYQYQFEIEKAMFYCKKSLDVLESNKDIIIYHLSAYCATMGNYISLSIQRKNFDTALVYINKYQETLFNQRLRVPPHLFIEMQITTSVYKMIIYADLCDFAKGLEIVQSVNSIFLPLKKHKRKDGFILFFYYAAVFNLFNNKPSDSLDYLDVIYNELDEMNRTDYYTCSMFLQLMAHYDLGNYRLLSSKVKSVKRFLQTRNIKLQAANIILKFFDKVEKLIPKNHKIASNGLRKELENIDVENIEESYFIQTLMIKNWLSKD
jgi:hypothetical protein